MENEEGVVEQTAPTVVDERDIPQALSIVIEDSDRRIVELQQAMIDRVNEASLELMAMTGLDPNDGWMLDLGRRKFIKIENLPIDND